MATLFTPGADTVDFNLLTPEQKQAIAEGANLYNGLGGNDVVTLPNIANYNESIGGGLTLNWENSAALPFLTGSKLGNTYTVTLGDGEYFIKAGAGTDVITVNGSGSGTITAGLGSENLTISGGGSLKVNGTFNGVASIGAESTLELHGPAPLASTPVKFAGADGTLKLDQPGNFTGTIGNLSVGDTIDLTHFGLFQATGSSSVAHTKINGTTLTVTMTNGNTFTLQLGAGNYSGNAFTVADLPNKDVGLRFANASPSINTNVPGSGYGNPYIDSLIWGAGKWNGGPITYWFGQPADFTSAAANHGQTETLNSNTTLHSWTSAEETAFNRAFDEFAAVCGLTFQLASSAATANIDLWLMPNIGENGRALGQFEVPSQRQDGQEWGFFNDSDASFANLQTGGDGLYTIVHELGHGMGLAHPHDGGSEPDATRFPGVVNGSIGDNGQNQGVYTVMSYNVGWNGQRSAEPLLYGGQSSPGAFDIAALQQLYGANNSFRTGDDTYTLPNANGAGTGWSCIWDAGGNNTISNAGSDTSCIIDLRAAPLTGKNAGGFISHDLGVSGGFTIANGVIMDGATGGSGNDLIIGNNTVSDNVDGGSGFDIFQIVGARADFTVTGNGASATVAAKAGGVTDNLTNVDAVAFAQTPVKFPSTNSTLHVTGDGLVVVVPLTAAATIEASATLQLFDSDTGNVTFETGMQESLVLDKSTAFEGHVVGFGASDRIDLVDIPFVNGSMIKTYTPLAADPLAGGTLTINDQAGHIANIKFKGTYTAANFNISNDGNGGTLITDPPVDSLISDPPVDSKPHTIANGSTLELAGAATGKATFAGPTGSLQLNSSQAFSGKIAGFGGQDVIDLGDIAFGANTTLGYRENASDTGGTLNVSDGIHSARIALLGNYMASSFATAGDGHGGTLITEASTAAANLQPLITVPHA